MLIEAINLFKSVGAKHLFENLSFTIVEGEKIALIGRNGHGKTTLLKMLSGEDQDVEGKINIKKGIRITLTKQEHLKDTEQTPLDYVLKSAPNYYEYKKILEEYEQNISTDLDKYLRAVNYFVDHNYFNIEDSVISMLADFNISADAAKQPLKHLSGGEKRYVEMTRMMFSQSDLFLVDEPTNHMDYKGKERFISWMNSLAQTIVVVTHDRDVLKHVDRIFELKDKKIIVSKGNYDNYIAQNATKTLTSVKDYADQLNRLKEAKKRVEWGLQMRAKSKEWKTRYDHWLRDYEKLKAETVKPSFWIDQNSVEELDKKVVDSYQKFKEKNIKIKVSTPAQRAGELLAVKNLSLGYDRAVFQNLHFTINTNDRVFIKGKNGAGKSTLVRTLMALALDQKPLANRLEGEIEFQNNLRIGEYQQEIHERYLDRPLEDAIKTSYSEKGVGIDERQVKALLAQYLFNPTMDGKQLIRNLSGGQKARFQLINMFIGEPNFLILDEPTNHLDLPSIEELEHALDVFTGGILYISHDTYFIRRMGGKVITL